MLVCALKHIFKTKINIKLLPPQLSFLILPRPKLIPGYIINATLVTESPTNLVLSPFCGKMSKCILFEIMYFHWK